MTRIVVVGGGAGGMELLKKLGKRLGKTGKAEITLVDVSDFHIWKPLLHELATGSLDEGLNAVDYRSHGAKNGYRFEQGPLVGLDKDQKQLRIGATFDEQGNEVLPERSLNYDYLVIGVGAVTNDFGIPGVQQHSHSLDLTSEAMTMRKRIHKLMLQHSQGLRHGKLKMAIVGGGATGVEMAAEMHHLTEMMQSYGFDLGDDLLEVTLIEAGPTVMPGLPKAHLRAAVAENLELLGVTVLTDTRVTEVTQAGLMTASGEFIQSDLTLWAAGVKAPEVLSTLGLHTNTQNQLSVSDSGQSLTDPTIFAFGDCASVPQPDGSFLPARGQTARQLALLVADNLMLLQEYSDVELKRYVYKDLGSFVNLARFHTVGNMFSFMKGGLALAGCPARFVYASLYRRHMLALHGPIKGGLLLALNGMQRLFRPQLKLW